MAQPLSALVAQLNQAGHKYGVDPFLLLGVFGLETGFGNNVKTSSAGAVGNMQFEPATAAAYGYPMTNSPTPAQAQQQFDAAAHYLSDLHKTYGSWDTALRHYSGGGYGLAEVTAKANSALGLSGSKNFGGGVGGVAVPGLSDVTVPGANAVTGAFNSATSAVSGAASTIGDIGSAVGSIASLLTSTAFWLRLGEAIAGIILVAMGLRTLSGNTTGPTTIVKAAAARAV